jgi:hypothetical protein
MGFDFKEREVAVGLKKIYEMEPWRKPKVGNVIGEMLTHGYIFKTPAGGIPARNGDQCGKAKCTAYFISRDGKIKPHTLPSQSQSSQQMIDVEVYNPFSTAIVGDRYITAKNVFGQIVVDAEDCS